MRRASILLAVAATFLGMATGAQAAPIITAEFCNGTLYSAENWSAGGTEFQGFTFANECDADDGLQILSQAPQTGEQGGWYFYSPPETPVISYSFDLDDADTSGGVTYFASSCDGCAPDETITTAAPGDPTIHVTVPNPQGSGEIFIFARCDLVPFCVPSATPVRISNIKVKLTDETAPTAGGYAGGGSLEPDNFLGWTNEKTIPVDLWAEDKGLGVRRLSMNVEGAAGPVFSRDFAGDCSFSAPLVYLPPCPGGPGANGRADISAVADGIHDVTLSAEDVLENSATTDPAQLGIDRVAPAPPAYSTIEYTASGWPGQRWTSDPDVVMRWPLEPELADPNLDSPFKSQDFSTHRDGSPTVTHTELNAGSTKSELTLPSDGSWDLAIRYVDEAGNISEPSTETVGLDADAPFAPRDLNDVDWLSEDALGQDQRITWSEPEENPDLQSEVCGYVVSIDEFLDSNPEFGVDDATIATSWPLPTGLSEGVNYFHVRAVSCAGVASPTETSEIRIDTEAPEIALSGLSTPGAWISNAQTATIAAADEQSGVAKVGYAIDDGAITWLTDDHINAPIPEGDHRITAHAVDVAGNERSVSTDVRTDMHAPIAELDLGSVDDPTRIDASVSDADSGLASAAIELRRVDAGADSQERQWQPIGGAESITRGTSATVRLARVLDDAKLAAGAYELRVNAVDVAGNSSVAGAFAVRAVQLPLRRSAEISAAIAQIKDVCRTKTGKACSSVRKCARKSRCKTVRITDRDHAKASVVQSWSQRAALIGDALDPNGAPIVGASVTVTSTPLLHESEPIGAAVTDKNGHYELTIPAGPSRTITARLAGSQTQQPASVNATISVRSEITFAPKPRNLQSGKNLTLRGRVLHSEWLPVGGLNVSFQWYSPNGWATFANPTPTDESGRFSLVYPWHKTARDSSVRLRARIDKPAGWPFAPGSSDAVKITVRSAK